MDNGSIIAAVAVFKAQIFKLKQMYEQHKF